MKIKIATKDFDLVVFCGQRYDAAWQAEHGTMVLEIDTVRKGTETATIRDDGVLLLTSALGSTYPVPPEQFKVISE